jgi:hypothetical protein
MTYALLKLYIPIRRTLQWHRRLAKHLTKTLVKPKPRQIRAPKSHQQCLSREEYLLHPIPRAKCRDLQQHCLQ